MVHRSHNAAHIEKHRFEIDRIMVTSFLVYILILLTYFFGLPTEWQSKFDSHYGELSMQCLLVVIFSLSIYRATENNARLFWAMLTLGFSFWLAATTLGLFASKWPLVKIELYKDVLFLIHTAIIAVAIEIRPDLYNDRLWFQQRSVYAIGGFLLIIAAFGYFAILPIAENTTSYASPYILYAIIDACLSIRFLVAATDARNQSWRLIFAIFSIVFLLIGLADTLALVYLHGYLVYEPGRWLNLLWYLWYGVAVLATGITLFKTERRPDEIDPPILTPATTALMVFGAVLPLVHAVGYGTGVFDDNVRQARDIFVAAWIVAISFLLYSLYVVIRRTVSRLRTDKSDAEQKANKIEYQLERELRIRSLGRLSAGLAHDFGNTVSAIAMHAKAIENSAGNATAVKLAIDGLNQAVRYAQDLVAKLSAFGGSRDRAIVETFDINEEIEKTIAVAGPSLAKGIRLMIQLDSQTMLIRAERSAVHQVLTNYLYNAADAVGEQGRIVVSTCITNVHDRCASCDEVIVDRYVALAVTDSGPGIDDSLADNVFEPLISTKPMGKGSGLGLSTVHGVMHKIGGHVGLSSSTEAGTRFIAYFPLCATMDS
jgi:signal transduction histidine kinase